VARKIPNSDASALPVTRLSPNNALIREPFGIGLLPTSVELSLPHSLSAGM